MPFAHLVTLVPEVVFIASRQFCSRITEVEALDNWLASYSCVASGLVIRLDILTWDISLQAPLEPPADRLIRR